jgi:hypothetical protein
MCRPFTDQDLRVNFALREEWVDAFVDAHGRETKTHGQKKLLWSNVLGLALVAEHMRDRKGGPDKRKVMLVVAGASPGTHMTVLLEHVEDWWASRGAGIHLYDKKPLDDALLHHVSTDISMSFRRQYFEDADAKTWGEWRVQNQRDAVLVFFSDIRSDIHGKKEHTSADEAKIAADMRAQRRWVALMQPDYCMLKFHAPHATRDKRTVEESIPYFTGVLYEQGFAGLFSAEYLLFCTNEDINAERTLYSTDAIEGHAFFHTKHTRPQTYLVVGEELPYDDAFAAHVAHKAQALGVITDARKLLDEARGVGHVAHMHFSWPALQRSRLQALHARMLRIL